MGGRSDLFLSVAQRDRQLAFQSVGEGVNLVVSRDNEESWVLLTNWLAV